MGIEELKQDYHKASTELYALKAKYDSRKQELLTGLYAQLHSELGVEVETAEATERAMRQAYEAERDRLAVENSKPPYPEGTILVEWNQSNWSIYAIPSSDRAVMQIFRKGDEFLGKGSNQPCAGRAVLRMLKKDGTPGKQVRLWQKYWEGEDRRWLPEGVKHPNARVQS